jgi:hypothetical protein
MLKYFIKNLILDINWNFLMIKYNFIYNSLILFSIVLNNDFIIHKTNKFDRMLIE